jgi:glutamine amidotransferase
LKKKIYILDCGFGNIESVFNAISYLDHKPVVINNLKELKLASHLILPGVGNYFKASQKIKILDIKNKIKEFVSEGGLVLGICLGMQLLFKYGEEGGKSEGLDFFNYKCSSFNTIKKFNLPLPHMGFSKVLHPNTKIWEGIKNPSDFYFVHSYMIAYEMINKNNNPKIKFGITEYFHKFISYIESERVFGVQFHPEKSQNNGLKFLNNFINYHDK